MTKRSLSSAAALMARARAASLTPGQRSDIARRASAARQKAVTPERRHEIAVAAASARRGKRKIHSGAPKQGASKSG